VKQREVTLATHLSYNKTTENCHKNKVRRRPTNFDRVIDRDRPKNSIGPLLFIRRNINCSRCQIQANTNSRSCDNHQLPSPMSSHHPLFPNRLAFACIFRFLTAWVNNFFTCHPIKASLETGPFISNQFPAKRTPSCSGRFQEAKAHSAFLHSL